MDGKRGEGREGEERWEGVGWGVGEGVCWFGIKPGTNKGEQREGVRIQIVTRPPSRSTVTCSSMEGKLRVVYGDEVLQWLLKN